MAFIVATNSVKNEVLLGRKINCYCVWLNVKSKHTHGDKVIRGILIHRNAGVSLFTGKSLHFYHGKKSLMRAFLALNVFPQT